MRLKERVKMLEKILCDQKKEWEYRTEKYWIFQERFEALCKHLKLAVVEKEKVEVNEGPKWEVLTTKELLKRTEQKYQRQKESEEKNWATMAQAQGAAGIRNIYGPFGDWGYNYTNPYHI